MVRTSVVRRVPRSRSEDKYPETELLTHFKTILLRGMKLFTVTVILETVLIGSGEVESRGLYGCLKAEKFFNHGVNGQCSVTK